MSSGSIPLARLSSPARHSRTRPWMSCLMDRWSIPCALTNPASSRPWSRPICREIRASSGYASRRLTGQASAQSPHPPQLPASRRAARPHRQAMATQARHRRQPRSAASKRDPAHRRLARPWSLLRRLQGELDRLYTRTIPRKRRPPPAKASRHPIWTIPRWNGRLQRPPATVHPRASRARAPRRPSPSSRQTRQSLPPVSAPAPGTRWRI